MKRSDRPLGPLLRATVAQGRKLLAAEVEEYAVLLEREKLPRVDWTRRPLANTWAFWTVRMAGSRRGTPEMRINGQPSPADADLRRVAGISDLARAVPPRATGSRARCGVQAIGIAMARCCDPGSRAGLASRAIRPEVA